MAGIIIHLAVALLCFIAVHLIHFRWEYSWSVFAGNFLPDVLTFGVSAVKQGTLAVFDLERDEAFKAISSISSSYAIWFSLGFFVLGIAAALYHFHVINKKKMEEYDELYVFLLIGIIIHLVLDVLVIEATPWI